MIVGTVIQSARNKYGVPAGSNRWNDTTMLQLFNDATSDIAKETDFPEATYPIPTVPGQREYQMIDCAKILRCYLIQNSVFATPLPGTDIPTLEGDILMIYDQSSGLVNGAPGQSPQWLAAPPANYPLTNSNPGQVQVASAMPFFSVNASAQRGEYYHRGGNIGVVPPPMAGGLILAVDHVPLQPYTTSDQAMVIYPTVYLNALSYYMCKEMAQADRSAMVASYSGEYTNQLPGLRTWVDNLWATKPKRFVPITKRTYTRYGGDWGGWDGW